MKPSNLFTVHKYIEILLITHFAIFLKENPPTIYRQV